MTTQILCPNCFQKGSYTGGKCTQCGYERGERPEYALPEGYVLAQHYSVGRVVRHDEVMITYLVQDLRTEEIQAVREYFPVKWVKRSGDGIHVKVAVPEKEEAFHYGMEVLENEGKILHSLSEDTIIIKTGDFLKKNDTAYLLCEHVEGENIAGYMKRTGQPFSPQKAGEIIRKMAVTVEDLHKIGLIHRGIGPDSVLLLQDGSVKMIDFEATRQYVRSEMYGLLDNLKEGFAPSEQYAGLEGQGTWTDVYALAATYYYMVSGVIPLSAAKRSQGENLQALNYLVSAVSERVGQMISRAMTVMYWERIQTISGFIDELNKAEGITPPEPYLRLKSGDEVHQWKIEENRDIRIGRSDEECEICVEGENVSRLHCMVHYDGRKNIFLVKDMSANGTFTARGLIGRGRIAEVTPGERIYLVSNRYELYLEVK